VPFFATFTGASSFEVLGGGRRSACNSTRQLGLFTLDESAPMSPDKHVCPSQVAFADRIPVISRAGSAREHCYIEFSSCNQPLIADGATKLLAECASAQAAAGVTSDIAFGRCRSRRRLASANCPSAPRRLATPFVPYLSGSTPFIKIKDDIDGIDVIWRSTLDCRPSAPSACTIPVSKQAEKAEVFFRSTPGLSRDAKRPKAHVAKCSAASKRPYTPTTSDAAYTPHSRMSDWPAG
jgi:hypothetical protein